MLVANPELQLCQLGSTLFIISYYLTLNSQYITINIYCFEGVNGKFSNDWKIMKINLEYSFIMLDNKVSISDCQIHLVYLNKIVYFS